jgi:acetylornithine deacetylase/succinyl-diaminopimelate desuccinylase-like protein
MDQSRERALERLHSRREEELALLREFLKIPSVSTEPERRAEVLRAADWLAARLRALELPRVEILDTGGAPVVFAETRRVTSARFPSSLIFIGIDLLTF